MIVSRKCNEVDVKLVARASDFVLCDSALDHGVEKGEAQEGHSAWRECLLPGPTLCHYKTYKARLEEFRRGRLLAYELIRHMPNAIRGRLTS